MSLVWFRGHVKKSSQLVLHRRLPCNLWWGKGNKEFLPSGNYQSPLENENFNFYVEGNVMRLEEFLACFKDEVKTTPSIMLKHNIISFSQVTSWMLIESVKLIFNCRPWGRIYMMSNNVICFYDHAFQDGIPIFYASNQSPTELQI